MDLEMKCPHCECWTSSEAKSCSECGSSLIAKTSSENLLIKFIEKEWRQVIVLAAASILIWIIFRPYFHRVPADGLKLPEQLKLESNQRGIGMIRIPGGNAMNDAIMDYAALNEGNPPASLQQLVGEGYITELPSPPSGTQWILTEDGSLSYQRLGERPPPETMEAKVALRVRQYAEAAKAAAEAKAAATEKNKNGNPDNRDNKDDSSALTELPNIPAHINYGNNSPKAAAAIEREIRIQVKKASESLTVRDLGKIENLSFRNLKPPITDIRFLENFKNLKGLSLGGV